MDQLSELFFRRASTREKHIHTKTCTNTFKKKEKLEKKKKITQNHSNTFKNPIEKEGNTKMIFRML